MRFPILFLLLIAYFSAHAQDSTQYLAVQSCMISGPVFLQKPFISDSTNIFGDKYDVKQMLKTKISPIAFKRDAYTANFDTVTGYFTIAHAPTDRTSFYFFNFTVTAKSFAKAKLKVSSQHAVEIYIDDKKVTDKQSIQKNIDKASSADWPMTLEPHSYNISVKCLLQANDSLPPAIRKSCNVG